MPGMTRPATARRQEDALLRRPRQAALLTAVVVAVTAVVFALAADHGTLARIQRLDDAWLRLMISGRTPAFTAIAKVFNVLGLVYVTLPVRIAVAAFLALRRRWWHLAAFTAAVVVSEVLIGSLKGIYDRARPPGSLVATSGASFPSGHAVAASVTVVAAVIALVPAGRRRMWWSLPAVAFSILMALSRAYLVLTGCPMHRPGSFSGRRARWLPPWWPTSSSAGREAGGRSGQAEPKARFLLLRGTPPKDAWDRHEYRAAPIEPAPIKADKLTAASAEPAAVQSRCRDTTSVSLASPRSVAPVAQQGAAGRRRGFGSSRS